VIGRPPVDPAVRFWAKVAKAGLGDCWEWLASRDRHGYGQFRVGRRNLRAHRFAYELAVGAIPPGLQIDHLCRNRACVNPAHMEPVTGQTNTLRGESYQAANARKDRCVRGHPLDDENAYRDRHGHRHCRACQRAARRRHAARMLT
jgi:hypothetical protein